MALLSADSIHVHYVARRSPLGFATRMLKAVDGVSLSADKGETVAIVGESGCGKSTLGRVLVGLQAPTSGSVFFRDRDIFALRGAEARASRRALQIIFQDPYGSLNPRMTVGDIIAEPLRVHGLRPTNQHRDRVAELLRAVGLDATHAERFPHQFSGGQRQRIGIARALACEPELIVCDEPVSALDVSVRAQVVNLLNDLQRQHGFTYIFVSHDLSLVRQIARRVAVMYLGRIVELADTAPLFTTPRHPYSEALLSAIPIPAPRRKTGRIVLEGDLPSPIDLPADRCRFQSRCRYREQQCRESEPTLPAGTLHPAACHFADMLQLAGVSAREVEPSAKLRRRGKAFSPAS